ncbi:MAG: hypothetical protein WCK77_11970 [Verrucomicrobiota bacterium]
METNFFTTFGNCKNTPQRATRTKSGGSRPIYEFRFDEKWVFDRTTTPALRVAPDVRGVAFDADLNALAKQARRPLDGLEADFIWLAVAAYLADRCAPRYPYGMSGPAHWRRKIHLQIPVSDPAIWKKAEAALAHVLMFLTEDDWTFEFLPGRAEFDAERQRHFPKMRGPDIAWTSLFSGGLDSLAGALNWLARTDGIGLLVSGQTHGRIAVGQKLQVAELRERFPSRIEHVGVGYGFPDKHRHRLEGFESTQRSRAFVHTALGSVAALMAGNAQLLLFENGFGALNLPCDSAQFGSQNSRGTHPVFLRRMAELVTAVFSRPFIIANPFAFSTKAQMLSAESVRCFAPLLIKSFSCDRFPNYKHPEHQCGCCPSCLIRRLSFHAAEVPEDSKGYSTDIFNPRRPLREAEALSVSKITVQADSLAMCLRSREPWPALCAKWPGLLRTEFELDLPAFRESVIHLLRHHVDEWLSFTSTMQTSSPAVAA